LVSALFFFLLQEILNLVKMLIDKWLMVELFRFRESELTTSLLTTYNLIHKISRMALSMWRLEDI